MDNIEFIDHYVDESKDLDDEPVKANVKRFNIIDYRNLYKNIIGTSLSQMRITAEYNKIVFHGIDNLRNMLEPYSKAILQEISEKYNEKDGLSEKTLRENGLNAYDWEFSILKDLYKSKKSSIPKVMQRTLSFDN